MKFGTLILRTSVFRLTDDFVNIIFYSIIINNNNIKFGPKIVVKYSGIFISSPKMKKKKKLCQPKANTIQITRIFFIFVSDDWFSRNHVHRLTMRENHRDARSGLTQRVFYFFGQKKFDTFFNVYRM